MGETVEILLDAGATRMGDELEIWDASVRWEEEE